MAAIQVGLCLQLCEPYSSVSLNMRSVMCLPNEHCLLTITCGIVIRILRGHGTFEVAERCKSSRYFNVNMLRRTSVLAPRLELLTGSVPEQRVQLDPEVTLLVLVPTSAKC
jgi:hypothetical protein